MLLARTREPGRERDVKGRVKPLEGPTPETAMKHQERAQRYHIPSHKEAGYAESTIGILEARGMISVEQAELCKRLANLSSVLFGSGNARCSSAENIGRGLPNDNESKSMRETWTAYKAATAGIEKAQRRSFEHVILRNNYREWMRLDDDALFWTPAPPSIPPMPGDNEFRLQGFQTHVFAKFRELRLILAVIHALSERMPREQRSVKETGFTSMGEGMQNALYGGDSKLDELYRQKALRAKSEE